MRDMAWQKCCAIGKSTRVPMIESLSKWHAGPFNDQDPHLTWLILVHTVASNEIEYVLYFISIDLHIYQRLPKGRCLNPTGWCIGTPYHPFSILWKIQVHIYYTHGILVTHFCGIHIVTNHFVGSPGTDRANDPDVRGNPNEMGW